MKEEFDYLAWREKFNQEEDERQRYYQDLFQLPGKNLAEPDYLIDKLLPQGYLAIMAGDPKVGKTCLATAIAFAGLKTQQGSVLWLSLEESTQERAAALGNFESLTNRLPEWPDDEETEQQLIESTGWGTNDLANLPIFTCYERIPIDTEAGIATLNHWRNKTRAKLIVVDPLHAAHSGRSARKTLQLIKRFATQTRTTVLILHHLSSYGKNLRVAESAQLSACASMFMLLTKSQTQSPSLVFPRHEVATSDNSIAWKMREGFGEGDTSPLVGEVGELANRVRGQDNTGQAQIPSPAPVGEVLADSGRARGEGSDSLSSWERSMPNEVRARGEGDNPEIQTTDQQPSQNCEKGDCAAPAAQSLNTGRVGGVAQCATSILRLACQGRGAVNNVWFFQSNSPQHYELFNPPIIPIEEPIRRTSEDLIYETVAESKDPICAVQITQKTLLGASTIRNALIRLEAMKRIRLAYILSGTRYFRLPEEHQEHEEHEEHQEHEEHGEHQEHGEHESGRLEEHQEHEQHP